MAGADAAFQQEPILRLADSLQVFSGAPVFKTVEDISGTAAWFAGMVILGTAESRICHYIDARVIYAALIQATASRGT